MFSKYLSWYSHASVDILNFLVRFGFGKNITKSQSIWTESHNLWLIFFSRSFFQVLVQECLLTMEVEQKLSDFVRRIFQNISGKWFYQISHFLMTFRKRFSKFKYILHLNFWTLKVHLLIYLVLIQVTLIYLKYLLSSILKMPHKYLARFLQVKVSIKTNFESIRYKFNSSISFDLQLLSFLNQL